MKRWPKRLTIVGHIEIGDIWLSHKSPKDDALLWEPHQRRVYVLQPLPKKRKRRKAKR